MLSNRNIPYAAGLLACVFLFMMLFSLIPIEAAAVAVTGVSGVEVTVDSNGSISESNGTVTVTAKGSFTSAKTATITVTNTSGSTAYIIFDYSGTQVGACSLGGVSSNKCSGTKTVLLTAGATTTFTITSRSWNTNTTVTMTLSNFKVEAVAAESDVTVTYGSLGSVKIDGTTVASGSVNKVSSSTGASFVAVPGSGSKFVAWINPTTNDVISTSATYQLIPTEAMTIRAVFANASAAPVFYADGTTKVFESLDAAISYASSASNKTITLASDGTLPAGNYTIPAGVTVNIPYDAAGTLCTTVPTIHNNAYTKPTVFRTLNMASGANLTVNGKLSLSAAISSKYSYNGMPSGPLPFIKMATGSKITVENGAGLYAWGYITGSGSVEIKSGGTVYENFQIADYRGGDATSAIVGKDDEYGVFPFNQFYIQNIEVPMTLHAGAIETGYAALYVTMAGTQKFEVPFIGSDKSMFILSSGYVIKDYQEGKGRTTISIHGDVSVSSISLDVKVSLIGNLKIDASKYMLPIPQHFTVSVESGNVSIDQNLALLPGSELYIRDGAVCTLASGKKVVVYDLDQWLYNNGDNGYSGTTNLPYVKTKYVPGGDGVEGRSKDALVQVDGTINAVDGAIYVTSGGANIYSTGTGVINMTPGTDTITYQVITNDTDIGSWPEITLSPALLQDDADTSVSADVAGEYKYYAATGKWDKPGHRYEATIVAPTCTEKGYTKHTCSACGTSYVDTEVAALGHTEVIDAAVAPTCTATGLTEGSHCSVCNEVLVAQQTVAKLAHTEAITPAVAPTCTETGLTEGKHCSVCGTVTVAQQIVAALGHSYTGSVTQQPTCTETGVKTYTCTVCGHSYTEEIPVQSHPVNHATNVELGNSLNMYFAFWGNNITNTTGHYVEVSHTDWKTKETKTLRFEPDLWQATSINVNGTMVQENAYVVYYKDLSAKQMGDTITVTLYDGSNKVVHEWSDSIQNYAMRMLKKYEEDENKGTLRTLIVDMLNYGAACQTESGYNADHLVNAGLSAAQQDWATDEITIINNYKYNDNSTNKTYHNSSNLVLTGNIQFLVAFNNNSEINRIVYTFASHWKDGDNGINAGDAVTRYEWYYGEGTLSNKYLVVADARQMITITVYDKAGNELGSWEDSVESYCARIISNTDATEAQKAVCTAFMKFSDAAEAYLEGGNRV